jgi:tetrahydromethanopterin S-methyltransferase subunit G
MDKKLDKIEEKLDIIAERLGGIDKTLERNTVSLEYHILRTDKLETQLEPVKAHVQYVNGALKFIGLLGLLAGIYKALS